jgi:D-glycero-D-manno-heptose 1,7-bisphosphate phosphatase
MSTIEMRKALFIDRDGTINYDTGYVHSVSNLKIYPDTIRTIKKYKRLGYLVIVVTNQSGIGRGYYTESQMKRFNAEINRRLKKVGAGVDAFYWCPHHPDDKCDCRKPNTDMVKRAARDFGIDIKKSVMIGDNDIADGGLARNLGMKYVILKRPKLPKAPNCAIVLAGGKGMRLRSVDSTKPKPLVAVGGKPVIAHVIDNMIRNGISDIIVCIGYKGGMIRSYVSKRYRGKANVVFSDGGDIDTGSRVRLASKKLKPYHRAVTVAFGDDVNDIDHVSMYDFHRRNNAQITLAIKHVNNTTGFGAVKLAGGKIKRFIEKPDKQGAGFVSIGVMIFSRDALNRFPKKKDFNISKDFLERAASQGLIHAYVSRRRWHPIDTPERYGRAKRVVLK